jgi:hypothetical protein
MAKPKQIHATVYGMDGTGANVREAREDAGRKIEEALEGSYTPIPLAAGGFSAVAWRTPSGWRYGLVGDGGLGCTYMGNGSKDETLRAARYHIGQLATDPQTCLGPDDVHPVVEDEADRRDLASWAKWQRQYAAARAAGFDDDQARRIIAGFTLAIDYDRPDPATLAAIFAA